VLSVSENRSGLWKRGKSRLELGRDMTGRQGGVSNKRKDGFEPSIVHGGSFLPLETSSEEGRKYKPSPHVRMRSHDISF